MILDLIEVYSMLYIDDIKTCIATFLKGGGYDLEKDWTITEKYDTNSSTRIPVYGITFLNKSAPLVPAYKEIKVVEGWELRGGMEHGTTYVEATIWMTPKNASDGKTKFSYIETEESLLSYLQTHFPTGAHYATQNQASNLAEAERCLKDAEAALNARKAESCVKDEDIQLMLLAVVSNAASSGLSASKYPQLKERIILTLQERIKNVFTNDFDRILKDRI